VSVAAPTRTAVWTRHWAGGSPHSCAGSYGDTYGGAIAAFWQSVLKQTAAGSRILDLATGAGALPRLFFEQRPDLVLSIDAVDLVESTPRWLDTLPSAQARSIRFHTGTPLENLPFADGEFDLVVSQYGLEYARRPEAIDELRRVRAGRGRTALVLHHADARPVRLAAVEVGHIEWLRAGDGLIAAARAMIEPMSRAATPEGRSSLALDSDALTARNIFNNVQERLSQRADSAPDGADLLHEARDAVAQALQAARAQGEATDAHAALSALESNLSDARLRLQELVDCALDARAAATLAATLGGTTSPPALATLVDQGHLMGWTLRIEP
jgi:SAM-dependent methyltransferase